MGDGPSNQGALPTLSQRAFFGSGSKVNNKALGEIVETAQLKDRPRFSSLFPEDQLDVELNVHTDPA